MSIFGFLFLELIMSSSPEGIERFKVTEEDLQDVFNPTRKKKFRMSKNQATYGIHLVNIYIAQGFCKCWRFDEE